jgi:hypothetical protein
MNALLMNFEDFQHLARLYVVGALEAEEMQQFETGRAFYGSRAESYVRECRHLESAFALSLQRTPPKADAKTRLLSMIRDSQQRR